MANFLAEIERFLAESGMGASRLGVEALRDPGFVASVRQGRNPRLDTAQKVLNYMEEWRKARDRAAKRAAAKAPAAGETPAP